MTPAMVAAPKGFRIEGITDIKDPVSQGRVITGRVSAPDGREMKFLWRTDDNITSDEFWNKVWADVQETYAQSCQTLPEK